jgi:hypothetical protein
MKEWGRYRVNITVKGGVSRPPYDGYAYAFAYGSTEAGVQVKKRLLGSTFSDVAPEDVVINSVERTWQQNFE